MNIRLKKAKTVEKGTGLEITYKLILESSTVDRTETHHEKPHPDLLIALNRLIPHLVFISELLNPDDFREYDDWTECKLWEFSEFAGYSVTGFVLGGADEYAGVTILGQKKLSTGKVLNLVAPFTKFVEEGYLYEAELMADVERAKCEVVLFLDGKHEESRQLSLFPEPPAEEDPAGPVLQLGPGSPLALPEGTTVVDFVIVEGSAEAEAAS